MEVRSHGRPRVLFVRRSAFATASGGGAWRGARRTVHTGSSSLPLYLLGVCRLPARGKWLGHDAAVRHTWHPRVTANVTKQRFSGAKIGDSAAEDGYKMPSQAIVDVLDRPVPPSYSFSPDRTKVRPHTCSHLHETCPLLDFLRTVVRAAPYISSVPDSLRLDQPVKTHARARHVPVWQVGRPPTAPTSRRLAGVKAHGTEHLFRTTTDRRPSRLTVGHMHAAGRCLARTHRAGQAGREALSLL